MPIRDTTADDAADLLQMILDVRPNYQMSLGRLSHLLDGSDPNVVAKRHDPGTGAMCVIVRAPSEQKLDVLYLHPRGLASLPPAAMRFR